MTERIEQRTPETPGPERRVREFLDAMDDHDRRADLYVGGWKYGDEVHGINQTFLTRSDLRDILNELEAWRDDATELKERIEHARNRLSYYTLDPAIADIYAELGDEP